MSESSEPNSKIIQPQSVYNPNICQRKLLYKKLGKNQMLDKILKHYKKKSEDYNLVNY